MRYMMFIKHTEDYRNKTAPASLYEAMGVFVGEAMKTGKIVDTAGLQPTSAGTRVRLVLGRRPNRHVPRPLEKLSVRARLELALEVTRENGALSLRRIPIAVDDTPLRIRGTVGSGLYRAARAAGADPAAASVDRTGARAAASHHARHAGDEPPDCLRARAGQ